MKSLCTIEMGIKTLFCLFAAAVLPTAAIGQTTNDLVRIEGRVQSDSDRKDLKDTSTDEVTQNKTVTITITGKAKTPETRTGKWVIYGRSIKGNDLEVIESGEFTIDLAAGPQKVETKKVSTTYTPDHTVTKRSGGRDWKGKYQINLNNKRVEGSGKKYAGYVVIVKDGDKIVGSYGDPLSLLQVK